MRIFILSFFFCTQAIAIQLVLNGKTYNIKEFKLENNGQKIIIDHPSIVTKEVQTKIVYRNQCVTPGGGRGSKVTGHGRQTGSTGGAYKYFSNSTGRNNYRRPASNTFVNIKKLTRTLTRPTVKPKYDREQIKQYHFEQYKRQQRLKEKELQRDYR